MKILLPAQINADGILPYLQVLDVRSPPGEPVTIDVSALRRITPVGLVALAARIMGWRREQREVCIEGVDRCAITGYLQRLDLFKACGMDIPESFVRHSSRGSFVPVRVIDHDVDRLGGDMAACIAPGGEEYEHPLSELHSLVWYVLTETANNVRQHSQGAGFASAQVNGKEGLVRLAIADNGRGVLKSFQDLEARWALELDDKSAIQKALEPKVSCKGRPTNEGVGLTLVAGLMREVHGWLMIVSGRGILRIRRDKDPEVFDLPRGCQYPGTIIGMTFGQADAGDFAASLHRAKKHAGLLQPRHRGATFTP